MAMTTGVHFTTGPCLITWNGLKLGVSENGVEHQIQQYIQDVHSDDFGGNGGAPADQQWLGVTAMVQCVLTKFIKTSMFLLESYFINAVGEFIKQDNFYSSLVITGRNEIRTYPCAYVRQPVSFNSSARFRRWGLAFYCQVLDPCTQSLYTVTDGANPCSGAS